MELLNQNEQKIEENHHRAIKKQKTVSKIFMHIHFFNMKRDFVVWSPYRRIKEFSKNNFFIFLFITKYILQINYKNINKAQKCGPMQFSMFHFIITTFYMVFLSCFVFIFKFLFKKKKIHYIFANKHL